MYDDNALFFSIMGIAINAELETEGVNWPCKSTIYRGMCRLIFHKDNNYNVTKYVTIFFQLRSQDI